MGVLGVPDIKRVLPHRYPMLLLDAVLDLVPGERVTATKAVSAAEPWYRRLPDDTPAAGYAYPQVLVLESWCQCAALLAAGDPVTGNVALPAAGDPVTGNVALLGGVFGASFDGDVYPGDVLEHRVRLVRRFTGAFTVTGESLVGPVPVLRVDEALVALKPAGVPGTPPC